MRWFYLTYLFVLTASFGIGQVQRMATPVSENLSQRTNWFVNALPSGTLLVSSVEGLNVIVGDKTTVYKASTSPLYDSNIQSLFYQTDEFTVWFCTFRGFYKLDLMTYEITPYRLNDYTGNAITSEYKILGYSKGLLFIQSSFGVASYDVNNGQHKWQTELEPDPAGVEYAIWGTDSTILASMFRDSLVLSILDSQQVFKPKSTIYTDTTDWVYRAKVNSAGFINNHGDYYQFNGTEIEAYHIDVQLPGLIVYNSCQLWLAYSDHLMVVDLNSGLVSDDIIHFVSSVTSRKLNKISFVDINHDGTGLVSSTGKGVFSFDLHTSFTTPYWPQKKFNTIDVTGLHSVARDVVIATRDDGLIITDKQFRLKKVIERDVLGKDGRIRLSTVSGDLVYFMDMGGKLGVLNIANGQVKRVELKGINHYFYQLMTTEDGRVLFSAFSYGIGEIKTHERGLSIKRLLECAGTGKSFTFFKEFGNEGLLISDNEERVLVGELQEDTILIIDEIAVPGINDLSWRYPEDTIFFIANSDGVYEVERTEDSFSSTLLVNDSYLPCEAYVVERDSLGRIWMSTNQGIICLYPGSNQTIQYKQPDGVISTEFNPHAFLKVDERFVFGGLEGITVFNPYEVKRDSTPVNIFVTGIEINDSTVSGGRWRFGNSSLGELTYKERTVTFHTNAIDYVRPDHLAIRYRLRGADEDWVDVSSNSVTARYSRLEPDDYSFEVIARNASGVWNNQPLTLSFTVKPPYWETLWFRTLVMAVLLLIGFGLYKLRLQILRREYAAVDAERSRIASDVHDDLGGGFTSISALSSRALKYATDDEQVVRIRRLADVAERTSSRLREVIWAMDSRNDNTERLGIHLRQMASQFMDEQGWPIKIELQLMEDAATIRAEKRRAATLIVKELLHNIVKHSDATSIELSVKQGKDFQIVISEINGKGYDLDMALKADGQGVYSMMERAKSVGGQIQCMNIENSFVTKLWIPYDKNL